MQGKSKAEKPLRRPVARTMSEILRCWILGMTEEVHMQAVGFPFMQSQVSVQVQHKFISREKLLVRVAEMDLPTSPESTWSLEQWP